MVRAWGGPYQGTKLIDGATWFPYQPTTFPTPPFPEYSSGQSNFSAAGAEILKRFTRSDRFGASVTLPAGRSRVEPGAIPSNDVTLSWSTFSDAANEAGISRRDGVFHSDKIKVNQYLIRRGNYLTYHLVEHDPVYLTEPFIRSTEYVLEPHQNIPPYPCNVVEEVD